jgi:selenide, water dikinase
LVSGEDILILTKPLGTGILNTAMKADMLDEAATARLIATMAGLNRKAAEAMLSVRTHAATDVTGFGLAGHLKEMIKETLGVELFTDRISYFGEAVGLAESGLLPAGLYRNKDFYKVHVEGETGGFVGDIIYDPQTSGGLLMAIHPDDRDRFESAASERGLEYRIVGKFVKEPVGKIILGRS